MDKLRILGEPSAGGGVIPMRRRAMTIRRLGKSFLNYAVDPFLSGI